MLTESLPLHTFVATSFQKPAIQGLIENWRIETNLLQHILVQNIRELGIFSVTPQFEKELFAFIIYLLRNSPEIRQRVRKADEVDKARKFTRHAS